MATSEEMSGHEIAGESGNPSAVFSAPSENQGSSAGEGFGSSKFGASTFGGGSRFYATTPTETDEEIAGHEMGGTWVNTNALFPIDNLPFQGFGCGNGFGGGPFAAIMYGGAVPCNGYVPTGAQEAIKSNVEEFCILEYSCAL